MVKVGPDPRAYIQDSIRQKWGPETLAEAEKRLCCSCIFHILSGRPCRLLPITLEGIDCPYYAAHKDQYGEVIWNE